ncbi:MAG: hypothetical protein ACHP6H_05150 [Legionellales bacterium]
MKLFILFFLFGFSSSAYASAYNGFLNYDHNVINHIRTITFEPNSVNGLRRIQIEGSCVGYVHEGAGRVIIALTSLLPDTHSRITRSVFNLGSICGKVNECYEGTIKKVAESINLERYSRHEVIVSGNKTCSKLAFLFAASQLSFVEPHQHKVVLFSVPNFSDTALCDSISAKIKYKNDVLIFDYYNMMITKNLSYPGLLIEVTPRSNMHDIWNNTFTRYVTTLSMLGRSAALYFLINGGGRDLHRMAIDRHFFTSHYSILALTGVFVGYCSSRLANKHCIPSEKSVQEAFLRFKENYLIASDTLLENIGTLTWIQALRL